MRSDSILFDQSIPAGTIEPITLERMLPFPGRVKEMTMTFYPGQQKALQVNPYMMKAPDLFVSLAKFSGNRKSFSGDDSSYEISMNVQFGAQDKICVDVVNAGPFPYDLYVLFEIEYGVG